LLAKELLDDIELGRLGAEALLLKASRLARWVGSDEIQYWLKFEMVGYNSTNPISLKYMSLTGRWTNKEKQEGYWGPLAEQEAVVAAQKAKLASMSTPSVSGDYANIAITHVTNAMNACAIVIARVSAIRSRVLAHLHKFVTDVYYEKQFDNLSESVFERYKRDVDTLIARHAGDVLEKIPSVMDRLSDGDGESIRQALATCRRIIDAFADSIYPPTDQTIEIGGNTLTLDASKHQNRVNAYIHERVKSQSRKQRLRQSLSSLYDRVCTGVHNEVSAEEARALFLSTYLLIGEILHLGSVQRQTVPPGTPSSDPPSGTVERSD
jgi:hypothetical protein